MSIAGNIYALLFTAKPSNRNELLLRLFYQHLKPDREVNRGIQSTFVVQANNKRGNRSPMGV